MQNNSFPDEYLISKTRELLPKLRHGAITMQHNSDTREIAMSMQMAGDLLSAFANRVASLPKEEPSPSAEPGND